MSHAAVGFVLLGPFGTLFLIRTSFVKRFRTPVHCRPHPEHYSPKHLAIRSTTAPPFCLRNSEIPGFSAHPDKECFSVNAEAGEIRYHF